MCIPELSTVFDNKNEAAKEIVEKIVSLPLEDRVWPNCLGRPVRNSSPVDIEEFKRKMEAEEQALGREQSRTVAHRTRSRAVAATTRLSSTPQTVSSDSLESPKTEKGLEVSSSRLFAKGTSCFLLLSKWLLVCMFIVIFLLFLLPTTHVLVEYKTPGIKPPSMSTKDMFAKRARDEKSVGTSSSKAPMLLSPSFSPEAKKMKVATASATTVRPDPPLVSYGYNAHANPLEFAHYLDDLLLPQYIESSNGKSPVVVSSEATGYAFHVSPCFNCDTLFILLLLGVYLLIFLCDAGFAGVSYDP